MKIKSWIPFNTIVKVWKLWDKLLGSCHENEPYYLFEASVTTRLTITQTNVIACWKMSYTTKSAWASVTQSLVIRITASAGRSCYVSRLHNITEKGCAHDAVVYEWGYCLAYNITTNAVIFVVEWAENEQTAPRGESDNSVQSSTSAQLWNQANCSLFVHT